MSSMETSRIYFVQFIDTAFDRGGYSTDDVIAFLLPLIKQVSEIHESGKVALLGEPDVLYIRENRLEMEIESAMLPTYAPLGEEPAYGIGYGCFETLRGHNDPQTDIFSLGLLLASMALGLNLYKEEELRVFVGGRSNPSKRAPRIHPTVHQLIREMTELDRRKRTQDLYDVIGRLEHYRDYDPEKSMDLGLIAGWVDRDVSEREAFILNKLRNRLYDTSRRNRLLFYKPNMRLVNLTVSSVPVVLHYDSIRPELLFTWNEEIAGKVIGMKDIVLNKFLRFEDHAYLAPALDGVRVDSRRAMQEYGLNPLKLVIAFLNWHNLKEDAAERIQSPLLLLPVELKKNKKLSEDHFVLKVLDNTAEVNPVLAGQLKELYGIRLPDMVDLDEMSPEQFYAVVKAQIDEANQGITINYVSQPRLMLIQREARQTVRQYNRRLGRPDSIPQEAAPEGGEPEGEGPKDATKGTGPQDTIPKDSDTQGAGSKGGEKQEVYTLAQSDNDPYRWDFDICHMVLGNFNYKKMSLVRDYNVVIDQHLQHPVFDALFSNQPRPIINQTYNLNRPDDWHHVIKADPTQTRAILQSRAGYSYIIQGPPGTGKSQTITNLIADFVARGKNILFVCEKRAALDVVYARLKQQGLDELCCYIHDSQGDKREFIKDLKATYEDFTAHKMDLPSVRARRSKVIDRINRNLDSLRAYHDASTGGPTEWGVDVRGLIERVIALRQDLPTLSAAEEELLPAFGDWIGAKAVVGELTDMLEETGAAPVFATHPFSKVREDVFMADSPVRRLEELTGKALGLLDGLTKMLDRCGIDEIYTNDAAKLQQLIQFAVLLHPLAVSGNLALADPYSDAARELNQGMSEYRHAQELYQEAQRKNVNWKERVSEEEIDVCISLAAKHEGSFMSMLNGPWQKLKKQLKQRYDLSAHMVQPTYLHVLETLKSEYAAARAADQAKRNLQQRYRVDNIDTMYLSVEVIQGKKGEPVLEYLLRLPDAAAVLSTLQALRQPMMDLEKALRACLYDGMGGSFVSVREILESILDRLSTLPLLLTALRQFCNLAEPVKAALRALPLLPLAMEAGVVRKTLHQFYQSNRNFAGIDGAALDKTIEQIGQGYTELQSLNSELIRAFVRHRFAHNVDLTSMPGSQLNEEQKKFKKTYNEGRKILENEFGKTIRYKSIRELSEKESGRVLKDIKPVWLMSPYSVSDSLPLDNNHFDVVIFDEASQITLEDGVPALYRAQQTIIVGDERQMPPTDFFSAKAGDPDDLAGRDEEDGDDWLSDDVDSLLAQGARKLDSSLLSWHYRSHYETLISFSNHAFYEGALLTVPDKTIHHELKPGIEVAAASDAVTQVESLFDRSISYHYYVKGVYEKRSNQAEAEYIAEMVRSLLSRGGRESIGIVAFSQEQQKMIERALDVLAEQDAVFAQRLEEAYTRTEDGQFIGLIVKNLENIQGDERDIIIMSVCYGFDVRGKMLMNFGPINKKGGEKRLNVLFSRAKTHMAVVSSIRPEHITNVYNEGANYLRRWLEYASRVSRGQMTEARAILDGLTPRLEGASDRELTSSAFVAQLRQQIEAMGYTVMEGVGQSGFKCSLAVKLQPGDAEYALGIMIDDESHYANGNLLEQYYQRPAVLTAFGWRILPVYAKDWLHQPQRVMDQIKKELGTAGGKTP